MSSEPRESPESDPELSHLLRLARGGPSLPWGFEAAVWRRVRSQAPGWAELLTGWLSRARWAWAVMGLALVLGLANGWSEGRRTARFAEEVRYVLAVDPTHSVFQPRAR